MYALSNASIGSQHVGSLDLDCSSGVLNAEMDLHCAQKKGEHVEEQNSAERPGMDNLAGQLLICPWKSKTRKLLWRADEEIDYCFMKAEGHIKTENPGSQLCVT